MNGGVAPLNTSFLMQHIAFATLGLHQPRTTDFGVSWLAFRGRVVLLTVCVLSCLGWAWQKGIVDVSGLVSEASRRKEGALHSNNPGALENGEETGQRARGQGTGDIWNRGLKRKGGERILRGIV